MEDEIVFVVTFSDGNSASLDVTREMRLVILQQLVDTLAALLTRRRREEERARHEGLVARRAAETASLAARMMADRARRLEG